MAFDLDDFNNWSSGAANGPKKWAYVSTADTLATIIADDYFLTVGNSLNANDEIYCVGTDGQGTFRVSAASATTVTLGESSGLASTRVTIATGAVLTIRATPVQLVAAPGAGKILLFNHCVVQLDYNSAAYAETADNLAVRYTDGSGVIVSSAIEATGFIDQTADTFVRGVAITDAITANSAGENAALVLHNTGDGEYTTGDSPLVVDCFYSVVAGV